MARGKLRIRQRGSRQQWQHARDYKTFDPSTVAASVAAAPVTTVLRCGLCDSGVEQILSDGRDLVLMPHATCARCGIVRCHECWDVDVEDEACEHEFAEVRFAREGAPAAIPFGKWLSR